MRRPRLIHSVQATAANVADSRVMGALLHGNETEVWGDQAYQGQVAVLAERVPKAVDRTNLGILEVLGTPATAP